MQKCSHAFGSKCSRVFPICLNDFRELFEFVWRLMYSFLMHSIFNISKDLLFFVLQDFMGKSDPFLEISRQASDGSWQVVHRTEVSPTSILYLCFSQKSRHMYMMWYKELISNLTQQLTLHCFDDNSVPFYLSILTSLTSGSLPTWKID